MSPDGKPSRPVAVYSRVSEQGRRSDEELLSHELQRRRIEHYLAAHELVPAADVFEDTDQSGRKMRRPAFDRAVQGVREGRLGGIAVARLSRFGRSTVGILDLIYEFEKLGAAVVCLDPMIDTSSASGRAMLTVFAAFVTLEAEQAVEQAGQVAALKLEAGTSLGGKPPVGYEFEVVGRDSNGKDILGWYIPSADAPLVGEAFERFDRGELATAGRVADFLNEHGLRTLRGNRWNGRNVIGFLRREAYAGVRTYGEVRIPNAHEAIVAAEVFRRVQRRLEPKEGEKTRVRGEGYVLGQGLCRCGHCGGGLVKGQANGSYPILRCLQRGCGHASISYALADDWIIGVAFAHLGMIAKDEGGNAEQLAAAQARLEAAQAELAEVEALKGTIKPAAFALAYSDALQALEQAEDTLAALDPQPGSTRLLFPAGARAEFGQLPVPEQRAALRSIVSRATIKPGRGHPAERIMIEFQDGSRHPAAFSPSQVPVAG